jgi:hypothetical protein
MATNAMTRVCGTVNLRSPYYVRRELVTHLTLESQPKDGGGPGTHRVVVWFVGGWTQDFVFDWGDLALAEDLVNKLTRATDL